MNSFTSKFHTRSHRKHRLPALQGSIPNGYLEDCSIIETVKGPKAITDPLKNNIKGTEVLGFRPVSISLTTLDDIILNADNNYTIKFNTGIVEGSGIAVNDGDQIKFETEGSYFFQISGTAVPYTNVALKLIYDEFPDDIKIFSQTPLPKDEGAIPIVVSTTLPIDANQSVSVRIVPDSVETITLSAGCRLLIFRVV
jgi:hypothetical protein